MATFDEMREKHRSDSMVTLSFFLFLLLIFVFHSQYISAANEIINKPENLSDVLEKSWLVLILTLISPFAAYFLGVITIAKRDLYYSIDNAIFKRRAKINQYICQKLLDYKVDITKDDNEKLSALRSLIHETRKSKQIMSLFYRYIEKDDVVNPELKSHAFIYWGDYFSSMMFIFWGCLALLGSLAIAIQDGSISTLRIAILIVIIFLVGLNVRELLWGKTTIKLFEIPETQIREIHRNAGASLLADLRAEGYFLENE